MNSEQSPSTLETVQAFNAAFNRHDIPALARLVSADVVFENTEPPPDGERSAGRERVLAVWKQLFDQTPAAHFDFEDVFACGERAICRWTYSWGSGHVRGVDVLTVRAGQVTEKLSYVKG
jgi:limonene-1,2-epoxide hydrolase